MRAIIVPLAGLAALALGAGPASAASPTYCALFTKEFVKRMTAESPQGIPSQRVRDRVYHKCLNRDDEPLLPIPYADPAITGAKDTAPPAATTDEVAEDPPVPTAKPAEETAALPDDPKPVVTTKPKEPASAVGRLVGMVQNIPNLWKRTPSVSATKLGGSGLTMWTDDWETWCAKHFPNSFDPKTGTVVPYETGVRTRC